MVRPNGAILEDPDPAGNILADSGDTMDRLRRRIHQPHRWREEEGVPRGEWIVVRNAFK